MQMEIEVPTALIIVNIIKKTNPVCWEAGKACGARLVLPLGWETPPGVGEGRRDWTERGGGGRA